MFEFSRKCGARKGLKTRMSRASRRPTFEPLEDRRYLSLTSSVDVFDGSMTFEEPGSPGDSIEAQNMALDLKIVLEGVGTFEELENVTIIDGVKAHFDGESRVHISMTLDSWSQALLDDLQSLGVESSVEYELGNLVEGWIAPLFLEDLAAISGVAWVCSLSSGRGPGERAEFYTNVRQLSARRLSPIPA